MYQVFVIMTRCAVLGGDFSRRRLFHGRYVSWYACAFASFYILYTDGLVLVSGGDQVVSKELHRLELLGTWR